MSWLTTQCSYSYGGQALGMHVAATKYLLTTTVTLTTGPGILLKTAPLCYSTPYLMW